MQITMGSAVFS